MNKYKIIKLDKKYKHKKFSVSFCSDSYYDIKPIENGFTFKLAKYPETKTFSFQDEMMGSWLTNIKAYGCFDNDDLIGFTEGCYEPWYNRFRINNIVIFNSQQRNSGVGTQLLNKMTDQAKKSKARMVYLETQANNSLAIRFYLKNGFEVIGFDRNAYSNLPEVDNNILVWMGKKLD